MASDRYVTSSDHTYTNFDIQIQVYTALNFHVIAFYSIISNISELVTLQFLQLNTPTCYAK